MSDSQFAAYEAKFAAANALEAEILPANKAVLFDALSKAGIRTVVVDFDGSGDSGQIQSIVARNAAGVEIGIPVVDVTVKGVDFNAPAITEATITTPDLIERMAYEFLKRTYGNWEDNDGAFGEFTLDVAEQSITLDYNERYVETRYHQHEF